MMTMMLIKPFGSLEKKKTKQKSQGAYAHGSTFKKISHDVPPITAPNFQQFSLMTSNPVLSVFLPRRVRFELRQNRAESLTGADCFGGLSKSHRYLSVFAGDVSDLHQDIRLDGIAQKALGRFDDPQEGRLSHSGLPCNCRENTRPNTVRANSVHRPIEFFTDPRIFDVNVMGSTEQC